METRPYVQWDLISSFMIDVFKAYGVPEEDAKICTDVLLGVGPPRYREPRLQPL